MSKKQWREFIKQAREIYRETRPVPCPALGNELVYFNRFGLNHLTRSGKNLRSIYEQNRRIRLFEKASGIISNAKSVHEYRKLEKKIPYGESFRISTAHFWAFASNEGGRTVIVLVRQVNDGVKHYFSVMDE